MTDPELAILVVEDNPIARKMVRVALQLEGYAVREAEDGHAALALVAREVPALIVQDLKLPDMSGLELLERLRALPGCGEVPVIALSGFRAELDYARSIAAGFEEFLFKPVEPSLLVRTVATCLRPPQGQPLVAHGRLLLVDDDPQLLSLGRRRFGAAGFEVVTAPDGERALEAARRKRPDVIVSDALMPGLDGFRLCAAIKQEPALATVPVILVSSSFVAGDDARLAARVGAEALIVRELDPAPIVEAALRAIREARRVPSFMPAELPSAEYAQQMAQQLERQVRLNASLSKRLASRRAELTILSAATECVLGGEGERGVLARTMESSFNALGIARGAVYLPRPDGTLGVEAMVGIGDADRSAVAGCLGAPRWFEALLSEPDPVALAGAPGATGPIVAGPLRVGDEPVGVFWIEVDADVSSEEWVPFAAAVGSQLSTAIALSRAFSAAAAGREAVRLEETRRQQLQIKDEFLSHVSHELRTPLTAVHDFVSIVLDGIAGEVREEQRTYLEIAQRNARELKSMIDTLLDATRSEFSALPMHCERLDLHDLVAGVLATLAPTAREKGVVLEVEPAVALSEVHADPMRVSQIVSNLVGNAIKFTPRGGAVVVRLAVLPEERESLRVSVADTGVGIPADERDRIFDYLYQGKNTADLARKGFGIGLHLCRELVHRHGGRIWAESTEGQGSTFHFTLPLDRVPTDAPEPTLTARTEDR